jgi:hypothetical protein
LSNREYIAEEYEVRRLVRRLRLTTTIGVLVAVPTLAGLGVYCWLFARSMSRTPTLGHLITLLSLWQTQTGAAFAIAAALIGATVILHQTDTTRRLEDTRRTRRAAALRAVLPLALMELSDYAARCAELHAELLAQPKTRPIRATSLLFPPLPDGLVGQLIELIETIEQDHARPLIVLVRRLQIHQARTRDTQRRAASQLGNVLVWSNVVGRVIDAVEIYARCDKLFIYARGEAGIPAALISSDDVRRALLLLPGALPEMEELERESTAARRRANLAGPRRDAGRAGAASPNGASRPHAGNYHKRADRRFR